MNLLIILIQPNSAFGFNDVATVDFNVEKNKGIAFEYFTYAAGAVEVWQVYFTS